MGQYTGGSYESYGRGWLIQPEQEKEKVLKMGEWNTMKIRVNGPDIVTWLNGVEMVHLTDEKIGEGVGEGKVRRSAYGGGKAKGGGRLLVGGIGKVQGSPEKIRLIPRGSPRNNRGD